MAEWETARITGLDHVSDDQTIYFFRRKYQ
jgi:hypothetical protein